MRYTAEASTSNTLSASSSITFRDKDSIEAVAIIVSLMSVNLTEEAYAVISFSQNPPGGSPDDFTMAEQEDVIALVQVNAAIHRYWNGAAAVTTALSSLEQRMIVLPTAIPVELGDRLYLHVFSTNPAILTDAKVATAIIHTKNQVTKTVRRR